MILHTFDDALAVARRIHSTPDAQMSRAITGLSLRDVASLAVLVHQLDLIAQGAAAFSVRNRDLDAWTTLQDRLIAAGYLPLSPATASQEPSHGED